MGEHVPKDAFTIVKGSDDKSRWVKIGAAFTNRDGSVNVILDALPCDGKIQIRERRKQQKESVN